MYGGGGGQLLIENLCQFPGIGVAAGEIRRYDSTFFKSGYWASSSSMHFSTSAGVIPEVSFVRYISFIDSSCFCQWIDLVFKLQDKLQYILGMFRDHGQSFHYIFVIVGFCHELFRMEGAVLKAGDHFVETVVVQT